MTAIVLTRPLEASLAFQQEMDLPGARVLIAPMLEIVDLEAELPEVERFAAFAFTSANGVKAFTRNFQPCRSLPVFAVGSQTAQAARSEGFTDVLTATGTGDDLVRLVVDAGLEGPLLHPCGEYVAGDLTGILSRHGYEAVRLPVYTARKTACIPAECAEAISAEEVFAVLFFSARAGENFCRLVCDEDLQSSLTSTNALSISERVLKSIGKLPWNNMYISSTPDREGMMELLAGLYQK